MDLGSVFLILALLVLVAMYVSRPFFERGSTVVSADAEIAADHELSALLAERDRIIGALQELDFDHALGKIPEEDFPEQRARLLEAGAEVLRSLDALQPQLETRDAESRLEAAVAVRRPDSAGAVAEGISGNGHRNGKSVIGIAGPDDDLEVMLADRRRLRREKAAGFCPKCGGPVHKSDHFCPKCGAKIV